MGGSLFFIFIKMIKLINEIEEAYVFTKEHCWDTTTPEWLQLYKVMTNCIEQYRREMVQAIFMKHHKEPIPREVVNQLWEWEVHLHLKGTIQDRLIQILENNL